MLETFFLIFDFIRIQCGDGNDNGSDGDSLPSVSLNPYNAPEPSRAHRAFCLI